MICKQYSPPWDRITRNMHILHILVVLTFETAVFCSCDGIKIKCTNIDEFLYASPETHCRTYYRCTTRGQGETEECEHGSMFDFYRQTCTRSTGICYEPTCNGRLNGVYQDTSHACRRSYTCQTGRITSIDNCPPKQLHNGQKCVPEELVSCSAPETTAIAYVFIGDQRCMGKADGQYGITGSCNEYFICLAENVFALKKCPSEQNFHSVHQVCLPKQLVPHCVEQVGTAPAIIGEHICRNKRDGATFDPSSIDCTSYAICKKGQLETQLRCGNQAIFNGESCVPSFLFQCPATKSSELNTQLIDICQRKPNGYYSNPQHGCSSYMRCISGKEIEVGECPIEQYFDAESRNCILEKFVERRRCFDRGISLDCDGKANGIYIEPSCTGYYYCYSGYKTEYKCSSGKVYNGVSCVGKSQFICPTAGGDTACANRSDGYFRDSNDGCRSYNFCSSGHKITYLCEAGFIFDGKAKKCVREQLNRSGNPVGLRCRTDYLCYGKSDGYHSDFRSNCRNYVFCKNYEKITQLTCRENNVFNGQKCVPPSEYACPSLYNHRQLNCMPKHCIHQCRNDGFYPDLNSDCRDYFFCIGGKASKLSCPFGKRFNGEICVAEDKFSCPVFCDHNNDASSSCPLGGFVE